MNQKTQNGYDIYEVMSALQKSIRRAETEDAMYWALELAESGYMKHLLTRLTVIAHEDIGTGDMTASLFALQAIQDTHKWFVDGKSSWRLSLANAVIALSKAKKCRDADNLQMVVIYDRWTKPRKPIPDYALDKHTRRGRAMGRGVNHFLDVGCQCEHDVSDKAWKERARIGFVERERRKEDTEAATQNGLEQQTL